MSPALQVVHEASHHQPHPVVLIVCCVLCVSSFRDDKISKEDAKALDFSRKAPGSGDEEESKAQEISGVELAKKSTQPHNSTHTGKRARLGVTSSGQHSIGSSSHAARSLRHYVPLGMGLWTRTLHRRCILTTRTTTTTRRTRTLTRMWTRARPWERVTQPSRAASRPCTRCSADWRAPKCWSEPTWRAC